MTKGLRRVGAAFNPSGRAAITAIKAQAAALIDLIETVPADGDEGAEVVRLKALAQTAAEEAAMWAVKAAEK